MTTFQNKLARYSTQAARASARTAKTHEALVETICLAACVDGVFAQGEAAILAGQILATPGFQDLNPDQVARTAESILERAGEQGILARVRAISAALADDTKAREEAFALATLFAVFDGIIGDEEHAFLELLQQQLQLSDETASRITALILTEDEPQARG